MEFLSICVVWRKGINGVPSLVSQKERLATSRRLSMPALIAKHCWVNETKGALECTTSSSMESPILGFENKKERNKIT
jgi:hypothetical protein